MTCAGTPAKARWSSKTSANVKTTDLYLLGNVIRCFDNSQSVIKSNKNEPRWNVFITFQKNKSSIHVSLRIGSFSKQFRLAEIPPFCLHNRKHRVIIFLFCHPQAISAVNFPLDFFPRAASVYRLIASLPCLPMTRYNHVLYTRRHHRRHHRKKAIKIFRFECRICFS